jgi:hypothetical protein
VLNILSKQQHMFVTKGIISIALKKKLPIRISYLFCITNYLTSRSDRVSLSIISVCLALHAQQYLSKNIAIYFNQDTSDSQKLSIKSFFSYRTKIWIVFPMTYLSLLLTPGNTTFPSSVILSFILCRFYSLVVFFLFLPQTQFLLIEPAINQSSKNHLYQFSIYVC